MEDVKVDLTRGKTETKEIIIEPTFRNILFFSGSISYQEKHKNSKEKEVKVDDKYMKDTWDFKDYVWTTKDHLDDIFEDPNWKYLLCQQAPPVYEAGRKEFKLYNDNQLPNKKDRKELDSWLTTNGAKVGSFACTASVSGNNSQRAKYETVIYDTGTKEFVSWKRFSEENGWEVFKNKKWEKWKIASWKKKKELLNHIDNCEKCKDIDQVKDLQKRHKLAETGNLDPKTMKILFPTEPLGTTFQFWKEEGDGWYKKNKKSDDWTLWEPKPNEDIIKRAIWDHIRETKPKCSFCKEDKIIENFILKEFQKNHGLKENGKYDPPTIKIFFPKGPTSKPSGAVSNQSSRIPDKQLSDFVDKLIENNIGAPMFSVCDCNSFHTSGYLWGMYAKKMTDKNESLKKLPFVVINFDSHKDYSPSGYPSSDGWGGQLMRDLGQKGCCYTKVGSNAEYHCFNDKGKKENKSVDYGQLLKAVKKWFDSTKPANQVGLRVFISVDRDCLEKHQTQWDAVPPFEKTENLITAMDDLLKGLSEKDYVIGCDVTGLPESELMASQKPKCPSDKVSSAWGDTKNQIEEIIKLVKLDLNKTAKLFV